MVTKRNLERLEKAGITNLDDLGKILDGIEYRGGKWVVIKTTEGTLFMTYLGNGLFKVCPEIGSIGNIEELAVNSIIQLEKEKRHKS